MFRSAHARGATWLDALNACIAGFGAPAEGGASALGIVYGTEPLAPHLAEIIKRLQTDTGIEQWIGSIGLGVCASGVEYFDEPALAIMGLEVPPRAFRILPTQNELLGAAQPANTANLNWPDGDVPPLVLIHADSANADVLGLIDEIAQGTGGYLVGGLTASDVINHQVAGEVTGGGVSGVALSGDIAVTTSLSQGCAPIGEMHVIGRAADNIIAELDGRPALDVFNEDIGDVLAKDLNRVAGYIHAALPISGSDMGDYVVRNLVGIDEENRIIAIGAPVNAGDKIMFVSRDAQTAREDLTAMTQRLAKRADGNIKGGLYISCIARGPNMFGEQNAEMELIREQIGDIPLIGMYANGEISNNRLYSYTGVLTLFI